MATFVLELAAAIHHLLSGKVAAVGQQEHETAKDGAINMEEGNSLITLPANKDIFKHEEVSVCTIS